MNDVLTLEKIPKTDHITLYLWTSKHNNSVFGPFILIFTSCQYETMIFFHSLIQIYLLFFSSFLCKLKRKYIDVHVLMSSDNFLWPYCWYFFWELRHPFKNNNVVYFTIFFLQVLLIKTFGTFLFIFKLNKDHAMSLASHWLCARCELSFNSMWNVFSDSHEFYDV
jgi:hypothetical protein